MSTKLAEHHIELPSGTTAQRPTASTGMFRYNTTTKTPEHYNGSSWIGIGRRDGSTADNAATSGFALKNQFPSLTSGYYWIQSPKMPRPLQMYVDMTQDGGGYDFYEITGGRQPNRVIGNHSGNDFGLDLWIPRSKNCWVAAVNFVKTTLGRSNWQEYFHSLPIFRTNSSWDAVGGDTKGYTSYIMRDPQFYNTGAPDWQVLGGGRWWLRDTTFSEPNGDYNNFMFLSRVGYTLPDPYTGQDIGFNDGAFQSISSPGFTLRTTYLVSTNAKP
jgi:hypothetical protein